MAEPDVAEPGRECWITGIGIVSCLGEGPDAHWQALDGGKAHRDATTYAPYIVHPLTPMSFDAQIPKKGDQRQMEPWQRIGVYAAGPARGGAGGRDLAVAGAILTGLPKAPDADRFLNERLMNDLRPTLFLAQLSNLLAGNIAIVHGVTGSSRTFMGEEAAGVDAARIALARIAAGQSDIALIGGSQNGERKDLLVLYEFGDFNLKDKFASVWARGEAGGFALGSGGAFLVIESRAHAEARGAKPFARLVNVVADMARRKNPGDVTATLEKLWAKLGKVGNKAAIITGATGVEPVTSEERAFLNSHGLPFRASGTMFGHTMESQFPLGLALAALSLSRGALFPPGGNSPVEVEMSGSPSQIVVIGTGHWRGEGMALVEAIK